MRCGHPFRRTRYRNMQSRTPVLQVSKGCHKSPSLISCEKKSNKPVRPTWAVGALFRGASRIHINRSMFSHNSAVIEESGHPRYEQETNAKGSTMQNECKPNAKKQEYKTDAKEVQNMMRNKCETNADRNERETSKKTKQTWKLVWFRLHLLISPATNHLNHTKLHLNYTESRLNQTKLHLNYTWITLDYTWITPELHVNHTGLHLNHTWITLNYTWITTELHLNHTWITPELHLNSPQNQLKGEILKGALLEITTPKSRIPNNNARGLKQIVNRLADN